MIRVANVIYTNEKWERFRGEKVSFERFIGKSMIFMAENSIFWHKMLLPTDNVPFQQKIYHFPGITMEQLYYYNKF